MYGQNELRWMSLPARQMPRSMYRATNAMLGFVNQVNDAERTLQVVSERLSTDNASKGTECTKQNLDVCSA